MEQVFSPFLVSIVKPLYKLIVRPNLYTMYSSGLIISKMIYQSYKRATEILKSLETFPVRQGYRVWDFLV